MPASWRCSPNWQHASLTRAPSRGRAPRLDRLAKRSAVRTCSLHSWLGHHRHQGARDAEVGDDVLEAQDVAPRAVGVERLEAGARPGDGVVLPGLALGLERREPADRDAGAPRDRELLELA